MGGRQPGLAQEPKLCLPHPEMPVWKKTNCLFLLGVFATPVVGCSVVFVMLSLPSPQYWILSTGSLWPRFLLSGFPGSFCPGSCLPCQRGGSGRSLTQGWSSGGLHHVLVFCIFGGWYLTGFRPDPLALAPGNYTLDFAAHLGLLQVTATRWQWQIKLPSVPCYNFQLIINMLKMWQAWLMPLSTSDLGIRFPLAQRDMDLWGFCNHLSS